MISQGQVLNPSTTSYDNYVVRFSGATTFDVLNVSAPLSVSPNSANVGRVGVADAGVVDPQQITLDTYEIQFTSSSQYSVRNTTTGATLSSGNTYVSGGAIEFDGVRIVLSNAQGTGPVTGDRFTLALASQTVLANQAYTAGAPITFDGIQFRITHSASAPAAGDLFHVSAHTRYAGDADNQQIEVADGEVVSTGVRGDEVFSGSDVNLFDTVQQLLAALRGNFKAGIVESLDSLDRAISQVAAAQGDVGALTNRLESTSLALDDAKELATNTLSSFEDIDLARTISDLTLQEYAIQAAGASLGRIFDNTLLKYLR